MVYNIQYGENCVNKCCRKSRLIAYLAQSSSADNLKNICIVLDFSLLRFNLTN